ncbi:MAG: hypothetical protein OEV43_01445 [Coriobacteriia bacterium]|nr:hypothetical protein [Coriobacteriia bacterium]
MEYILCTRVPLGGHRSMAVCIEAPSAAEKDCGNDGSRVSVSAMRRARERSLNEMLGAGVSPRLDR